MNYHKNTDSSEPPRREPRKRVLNTAVVLLSKHGFSIEVPDPLPDPAAASSPVLRMRRERRRHRR